MTNTEYRAHIAALIATVLVMSSSIVYSIVSSAMHHKHDAETHMLEMNSSLERSLTSALVPLEELMDYIQLNPQFSSITNEDKPKDVQALLRQLIPTATKSFLQNVAATGEDGKIVAATYGPTSTTNPVLVTDRPYYAEMKDVGTTKLHYGPFTSRITGKPSYAIIRRLAKADNKFAGLLIGSVEVSYLVNLCSTLNLTEPHESAMVDKHDNIVLHCKSSNNVTLYSSAQNYLKVLVGGSINKSQIVSSYEFINTPDHAMIVLTTPQYHGLKVVSVLDKQKSKMQWLRSNSVVFALFGLCIAVVLVMAFVHVTLLNRLRTTSSVSKFFSRNRFPLVT